MRVCICMCVCVRVCVCARARMWWLPWQGGKAQAALTSAWPHPQGGQAAQGRKACALQTKMPDGGGFGGGSMAWLPRARRFSGALENELGVAYMLL